MHHRDLIRALTRTIEKRRNNGDNADQLTDLLAEIYADLPAWEKQEVESLRLMDGVRESLLEEIRAIGKSYEPRPMPMQRSLGPGTE
jgi:hypothetical protein